MPILILSGIGAIFCGIVLKDSLLQQQPPHSKRESEQIMCEMIGKSKKECRQILKKYRK